MIGDCRYGGANGSVLPADARQAKRLLKSLQSLKISARALIDAVNMVDVYLPSEQEADGGTFDPVMAALAASRAKRESGGGGASAAMAAFAPPSAHYTDHHKRAIRVATETLRRLLRETLDSMMAADAKTMEQYDKHKGLVEERMGLALHLAVDRAVDVGMAELAKEEESGDKQEGNDQNNDDMDKKRPASDGKKSKKKKKKRRRKSSENAASGEDDDDDDAASRNSNPRFDTTSEDRDRTFAFRRTTSLCLESLSLQVVARTTVTWGKKKMYEVYKLPRPLRPVGGENGVLAVRNAVEREFRAIFRGGGEDQCGIRVYGLLRKIAGSCLEDGIEEGEEEQKNDDAETYLFIHMCIGKPLDLHDENLRAPSGEKRKKKANEFIAILRPGSTLFALSASRAPSGSRFTKFLLPALARALSSTAAVTAEQTLSAERVGDISGTEPLDLLRSASSFVDGSAIGRYSNYAEAIGGDAAGGKSSSDPFATSASGTAHDPLVEMNQVSTGTLLSRVDEEKRLDTGTAKYIVLFCKHLCHTHVLVSNSTFFSDPSLNSAAGQHGQTVSNLATNIAGTSVGSSTLVAANQTGLIVDHSAASSRAKKRDGDLDFGKEGACPRLDRVCWKWSGTTHAASKCWEDEEDAFNVDNDTDGDETGTKFKCGIVMEGSDVFGGLRALVASGIAKAPLPNYVRDAATTGTKTITVADGAFGAADSLAAV